MQWITRFTPNHSSQIKVLSGCQLLVSRYQLQLSQCRMCMWLQIAQVHVVVPLSQPSEPSFVFGSTFGDSFSSRTCVHAIGGPFFLRWFASQPEASSNEVLSRRTKFATSSVANAHSGSLQCTRRRPHHFLNINVQTPARSILDSSRTYLTRYRSNTAEAGDLGFLAQISVLENPCHIYIFT